MADTIAQSVGVDISKDTLDVHLHPAGTARRFLNTRTGRSGLIAWLAKFTIVRIVFEPTGPYQGLSDILCGRPVSSLADEPLAEDDGELGLGLEPFAWRSLPVLGRVVQHQV